MEILGAGSLTEREILRQIGDNRYSREIVRKLLQDGVVYRVGRVRICICFCLQTNMNDISTGWCKRSIPIRCCRLQRWAMQGENNFHAIMRVSLVTSHSVLYQLDPSTKDWPKWHSKFTRICWKLKNLSRSQKLGK